MNVAPLRRITGVWTFSWMSLVSEEHTFGVTYKLECGHTSVLRPYRYRTPYPKRRRCSKCLSPA